MASLREKYGFDPERPTVLSFGVQSPRKSVDLLIDGFAKANLNDNWQLVLAGSESNEYPGYQQQLREQATEFEVDLTITGFVDAGDIRSLFEQAEFHAQTPRIQPGASATLSLGIGWEVPCMVTHVGAAPERVTDGETGILVEPKPKAVAKGFQQLADPKLREHIRKQLGAVKEEWGWGRIADKHNKIYRSVV
ncbi:glycosyltransferase family 4 protein [Natribaculum luteum]|uniref:Glycosyltransferase family 4 protein n=1 Tax=Natribaculum luteum TaxID=1586232 RepID=A0ABD5NXI5_9EURY|nr:glycosyltransferase family 4 protein [Natribaculum luteum]